MGAMAAAPVNPASAALPVRSNTSQGTATATVLFAVTENAVAASTPKSGILDRVSIMVGASAGQHDFARAAVLQKLQRLAALLQRK